MGSIAGDGQDTSGTRSLAYMGGITGDGQNTSDTRSLTTNLGIGNNISNTMGMSSANNPGLGNNISSSMDMGSTNNPEIGNNIANTMTMSSINLGLGSKMSNMLVSSSMSNLGLGSNMNNQAVSLSLAGVGASGTSSLGSDMSSLNFSRQIVGRGQNMSGTSRLSFNDRTGASGGDMARVTERASGLKRDEFTSRGYNAFSPWNIAGYEKSLVQINQGQSAIALMDVINLGALTNFSLLEFSFNSFRDQRYHYEKQPHFTDEVASNVFPSINAPNQAHLDRLNYPIFRSPLHQNSSIKRGSLRKP